jgi:antirestriction protein
MGESTFDKLIELQEVANNMGLEIETIVNWMSDSGYDDPSEAENAYVGTYKDSEDFAYEMVQDLGIQSFTDFERYLIMSDTDRRLMAQEMADSYVDDIRDEDGGERLINEGGLDVDEYNEADSDRQEEMLDEAREVVYDELYNQWYDGLNDPYYFLVEQQGLYSAEDFAKSNFVQIDYEALAEALSYDYTFIDTDSGVAVFNRNFKQGGKLKPSFKSSKHNRIKRLFTKKYPAKKAPKKMVYGGSIVKKQSGQKMSNGGPIPEPMKWQDAQVGDSARVKEINRMGLIIQAYGRKFHLKFPNGTEKTFDANELEFVRAFNNGGGVGEKVEVRYADLTVGNDYFQVTRPDLGIEKIKITKKENGTYTYKSDKRTDETYVVKYQGRYTDNEKLYGIFENKDEAKQMAINLLTEKMSKYKNGGPIADKIATLKAGLTNPHITDAQKVLIRNKIAELEGTFAPVSTPAPAPTPKAAPKKPTPQKAEKLQKIYALNELKKFSDKKLNDLALEYERERNGIGYNRPSEKRDDLLYKRIGEIEDILEKREQSKAPKPNTKESKPKRAKIERPTRATEAKATTKKAPAKKKAAKKASAKKQKIKTRPKNPDQGRIMVIAKEIHKEGKTTWPQSLKKAGEKLRAAKGKTVVLKPSTKQTGTSNKKADAARKAAKPGKRVSKTGKVYYETRKNRTDV